MEITDVHVFSEDNRKVTLSYTFYASNKEDSELIKQLKNGIENENLSFSRSKIKISLGRISIQISYGKSSRKLH